MQEVDSMSMRLVRRHCGLVCGILLLAVSEFWTSAALAASPVEVLSVGTDYVSIAWRPVSADVKAWDEHLMPYPAPNSYLPGENGYPRIVQGPSWMVPAKIQCFTYESLNGHVISAALAFAIWGYRVSWFQKDPKGFIYQGSFVVPALWLKVAPEKYAEASQGRYHLPVPPIGRAFAPDTEYRIVVEPLKLRVHDWLDFDDASVCIPSFSPLIPSDLTFVPLPILWARGPKWYYGLSELRDSEAFPDAQISYADNMPPLSFNTPPACRDRYHYEGPDLPPLGKPWDDPWTARVYWWYGQPSNFGNGMDGLYWYPVCGPVGYVKKGGLWDSFGAVGPRVPVELAVRTARMPLTVVSSSPVNGDRGVSLTVRVEITYSLELKYLNVSSIRWQDSNGRAVEFGAQIQGHQLLLQPRKPLSANTDYRIIVGRNAVSAATCSPESDFQLNFSTKPRSGGGGGGGGLAQ